MNSSTCLSFSTNTTDGFFFGYGPRSNRLLSGLRSRLLLPLLFPLLLLCLVYFCSRTSRTVILRKSLLRWDCRRCRGSSLYFYLRLSDCMCFRIVQLEDNYKASSWAVSRACEVIVDGEVALTRAVFSCNSVDIAMLETVSWRRDTGIISTVIACEIDFFSSESKMNK